MGIHACCMPRRLGGRVPGLEAHRLDFGFAVIRGGDERVEQPRRLLGLLLAREGHGSSVLTLGGSSRNNTAVLYIVENTDLLYVATQGLILLRFEVRHLSLTSYNMTWYDMTG